MEREPSAEARLTKLREICERAVSDPYHTPTPVFGWGDVSFLIGLIDDFAAKSRAPVGEDVIAVLKPFSEIADAYAAAYDRRVRDFADEGRPAGAMLSDGHRVSVALGDCRRARAVLAAMPDRYGEGHRAGVIDRPREIEVTPPEREALRIAREWLEAQANRGAPRSVLQVSVESVVARIRTILGETAAAAGDVADTGDRAYISRNDDRP